MHNGNNSHHERGSKGHNHKLTEAGAAGIHDRMDTITRASTALHLAIQVAVPDIFVERQLPAPAVQSVFDQVVEQNIGDVTQNASPDARTYPESVTDQFGLGNDPRQQFVQGFSGVLNGMRDE